MRTKTTWRRLLTALALAPLLIGPSACKGAVANPHAEPALVFFGSPGRLLPPADGVLYSRDNGEVAARLEARHAPAHDIHVAVDTRQLAKFATLTPRPGCHDAGAGVFRCTIGKLGESGQDITPFTATAKSGAEVGDRAELRWTVSADGIHEQRHTTVTEIVGPEISQRKKVSAKATKPGDEIRLTPAFANRTWLTSGADITLLFRGFDGVSYDAHSSSSFGNCWYGRIPDADVLCRFKGGIRAHTGYRADGPIKATITGHGVYHDVDYSFFSGPPEQYTGHGVPDLANLTRGAGPPMKLTPMREDFLPDPGPSGTPFSGTPTTTMHIPSTEQADFSVSATPVRGHVGQTVDVKVTMRNNGPAAEQTDVFKNALAITPPEGTTITGIPGDIDEDHLDWICDRPKHVPGESAGPTSLTSLCTPGNEATRAPAEVGNSLEITVRVRIGKDAAGAPGKAHVTRPYDRTHGNDRAEIPLILTD